MLIRTCCNNFPICKYINRKLVPKAHLFKHRTRCLKLLGNEKNYPNFWEVTINQSCFWLLHFKLHISFIVSSHKVPRIYNPSNSISIRSWTDGFWWIGNRIQVLTYPLFVLGGISTKTLRSVAEVVITWFYHHSANMWPPRRLSEADQSGVKIPRYILPRTE